MRSGGKPVYFYSMKTVRLRIIGEVQGVGYRAWALRRATELGLHGWVRNRSDGAVEILATGPEDAVRALIEAAWHGPRAARVHTVDAADDEDDGSLGFTIRPTI